MFDEYEENIKKLKQYNFSLAWLDNSNQVSNLQAKVISQNLTDFSSFEYTYLYNIKTYFDKDIDKLLCKAAQDNNDWVLVTSLGTILRNQGELLHVIAKEIDDWQNIAVMGHVLDKKEEYYKLHSQALLVNLKWYRENNYPHFGQNLDAEWQTIAPIRSEDNFHDDYTPIWIIQGNVIQKYTKKHEGWNLIKTALDSGYEIKPFNHNLRNSKKYIYPDDNNEWALQLGRLLSKTNTDVYFLCNTEGKVKCPPNLYNTFDICMIPASGFNTIMIPWLLGMKSNTRVVVYDISQTALDASKIVYENYFGQDIKDFWEKNFIDYCNEKYVSRGNYIQMNNSINEELNNGMDNWLKFVKPNISYEFKKIDVLNFDCWDEFDIYGPNVYLNLSNIFHYFPTSILFSLKDKISIHRFLIDRLKNIPNNWYLDYRNLTDFERSIKNINDIDVNPFPNLLKMFPWNS